jgi:hypothetical protein
LPLTCLNNKFVKTELVTGKLLKGPFVRATLPAGERGERESVCEREKERDRDRERGREREKELATDVSADGKINEEVVRAGATAANAR